MHVFSDVFYSFMCMYYNSYFHVSFIVWMITKAFKQKKIFEKGVEL